MSRPKVIPRPVTRRSRSLIERRSAVQPVRPAAADHKSGVRGITICVEYDDILTMTLAKNLRYLDEMVVVTSPEDVRTQQLVRATPKARLCVTDAFYRRGAWFNKGLAMEEGFEFMGRHGWMMVLDADILLPSMDWSFLQPNRLYSPYRRILEDPTLYTDSLDWSTLPGLGDVEFAGYCQLFHAEDVRLVSRRPWYPGDWPHAGGCDSIFQYMWPEHDKVRPPFVVLHIGEINRNWHGRTTTRLDNKPLPDQAGRTQRMDRLLHDHAYRMARLPPE